jgi:hypothetical protein
MFDELERIGKEVFMAYSMIVLKLSKSYNKKLNSRSLHLLNTVTPYFLLRHAYFHINDILKKCFATFYNGI